MKSLVHSLLVGLTATVLLLPVFANDVKVRVEGPIPGGELTFGFHNDFLFAEGCGGTCFAPPVCQVKITATSMETPADVAQRLATAINADATCQAMGFSAVSSAQPDGTGQFTVSGPPGVVYNCCADFFHVFGRRGCCTAGAPTDAGTLRCLASEYCSTKINSLGCIPLISGAGDPSVTSNQPYWITTQPALNGKKGLLLYGTAGGAMLPFTGGILCAQPPIRRTPVQGAGGSPPPAQNCTGSYAFDFNAWLREGNDPTIAPGDIVSSQYWMRDPDHPDGTGIGYSNAHDFLVGN